MFPLDLDGPGLSKAAGGISPKSRLSSLLNWLRKSKGQPSKTTQLDGSHGLIHRVNIHPLEAHYEDTDQAKEISLKWDSYFGPVSSLPDDPEAEDELHSLHEPESL